MLPEYSGRKKLLVNDIVATDVHQEKGCKSFSCPREWKRLGYHLM